MGVNTKFALLGICLLLLIAAYGWSTKRSVKVADSADRSGDSIAVIGKPQNSAKVPKQGNDSIRHKKKVLLIKNNKYQVVFIGNSIIHTLGEFGGKYKDLKQVWEKYLKPLNALNLGYSGYRTENILWNLKNGELDYKYPPKLIVLLIGTNNADDRHFKTVNTAEEIAEGTEEIVKLIKERLPATKILLLRIFPRGGDLDKGNGKNIFHSSDTCIQTVLKAGLLTQRIADNKTVFWKDINSIFLKANGRIDENKLPDLLHPNKSGAEAWVKSIMPDINKLVTALQ